MNLKSINYFYILFYIFEFHYIRIKYFKSVFNNIWFFSNKIKNKNIYIF